MGIEGDNGRPGGQLRQQPGVHIGQFRATFGEHRMHFEVTESRMAFASRIAAMPRRHLTPAGPHTVVNTDLREPASSDRATLTELFPHLYASPRLTHLQPAVMGMTGSDSGEAAAVAHQRLRVGVVLSGGQASGGHNVIIGVHDYLQRFCPGSTLLGFLGVRRIYG